MCSLAGSGIFDAEKKIILLPTKNKIVQFSIEENNFDDCKDYEEYGNTWKYETKRLFLTSSMAVISSYEILRWHPKHLDWVHNKFRFGTERSWIRFGAWIGPKKHESETPAKVCQDVV